ncbi:related to Putative sterigmatocystin biosynthesis lipase/esterase STCI [Phialocephala subalpina]|uniref:Related to Putative sterigmatocystin biosynthesis lipase/esterase STCI n=1 Tax=Phialocephala subalpina TaxID=576137 RepID=A0A1L7WGC3_9HELO|nr:related to Putative sterigmatocystin biosynthesis lipase/esterase STCI [Phialocephala subalpina]
MRTKEELLALAEINPELEQIIKKYGPIPSLTAASDISKIRQQLLARKREMTAASESTEEATYVEEDRQIPVRDGTTIAVRIHKPKNPPADGSPIFVIYHGGGFCLGGLDNETLLCRRFTELGGIAVNVDYRLAPEHPFPVPPQDAYDALKWTSENFIKLGGNPKKGFLVGGISAGANFSAIVTHLYRDDKLSPPLTGTYLSIPTCMTAELCPEKYKPFWLSREQNKDAPILNNDSMRLFERLYNSDPKSKYRTPMLFSSHKDLPPTYFQICGMDPLRDEALIYEDILREESGVKTKVDLYPGLPHGFWSYFPEAEFSKKLQVDCVESLKWLLWQSS